MWNKHICEIQVSDYGHKSVYWCYSSVRARACMRACMRVCEHKHSGSKAIHQEVKMCLILNMVPKGNVCWIACLQEEKMKTRFITIRSTVPPTVTTHTQKGVTIQTKKCHFQLIDPAMCSASVHKHACRCMCTADACVHIHSFKWMHTDVSTHMHSAYACLHTHIHIHTHTHTHTRMHEHEILIHVSYWFYQQSTHASSDIQIKS